MSGGRRLVLLAGASLLSLAVGPALAAPCVPSTRTITTSVAGPIDTDGGVLTVTDTGSITNTTGTAIQASCPASLIDNAGIILASTGVDVQQGISVDVVANSGTIPAGGINNGGTIGQLLNTGTVRGFGTVGFTNTGSIGLLTNAGSINTVAGTGITNTGGIGLLTNSGAILGNGTSGLDNTGTIGQLANSGTIGGGGVLVHGYGVKNAGAITRLTNTGAISGTGGFFGTGYGIHNGGSIGELVNNGTISGGGGKFGFGYGLYNTGTIGAVINSGTIAGPAGVAIFSSGSIGPLTNSGVIGRSITIENQNFTIFGGTGSTFGTLTGGTLTVANGNLLFSGGNQLLALNISVNGGRGTVTNAGNLLLTAPQTISGNYVQGQAGSLIINLGTARAGRLDVTGTATLTNATVGVQTSMPGGTYTPVIGQRFTIVTAGGGIQGGFTAIVPPDGPATGTRFATSSDGSAITLLVLPVSFVPGGPPPDNSGGSSGNTGGSSGDTGGSSGDTGGSSGNTGGSSGDTGGLPVETFPLPTLILTANQTSVALALDMVRVSGAAPALIAVLDALPVSSLPEVFTQMAPTLYADGLSAGRDAWYLMGQAIAAEQAARRGVAGDAQGGGSTGGGGTDGDGGRLVWVAGLGQFARLNSGDAPGFKSTTAGMVAGFDVPLTPALRAGAAMGFTRFGLDSANSARLTGQALHLAVYGSYQVGVAFVDAQAGGMLSEGDSTRPIAALGTQAEGQPRMLGGGGMIRGGMRMMIDGWQIEPSVGLAGMRASLNGFTETQAGGAGQTIGGTGLSSLQTLADVRVERGLTIGGSALLVSARLGWAHELMQTRASVPGRFTGVPGSDFVVTGAPQGRDSAIVGLGATLDIGYGASVRLGYAGAVNSRGSAQMLSGTLRMVF